MLTKNQYLTLMSIAVITFGLAITNGILFSANRRSQLAIGLRQNEVQQASQLQVLHTEIAKALAELAIKSNDQQVLDLLNSNGITITRNAPNSASNATSSRPAPARVNAPANR